MAYQHPDPFWDFVRNFDLNGATSNGNGPSPEFLRGFPFFHPAHADPGSHHPHHHGHDRRGGRGRGHRHGPHHGPRGPPPHAWAGPFAWADWTNPNHEGAPWFQQQQQQDNPAQPTEQQAASAPAAETAQASQQEKEKPGSPETLMSDSDMPDPAEVTPDEDEQPDTNNHQVPPHPRGHCRRGGGRRCREREGRRAAHQAPFDLSALFANLPAHPLFQNIQSHIANAAQAAAAANSSSTPSSHFTPPLDLFNTPSAYVLHLSIPGAQKSDIGVDWDPERNVLRVAGVVHRPGDEEFLRTAVQSERMVGEFEREIRLPPKTLDDGAREDEIDADGITAKMEDGVLVVTVPKAEKEWTEIRKVDIE
ncbi:hypothetical protein NLU13_2191 [Sarocladium strictum]|uniref:SHSP domain-containing protein n=1 Tax=Sarocladium strictum TaxID=5046 RepID=A0AA39GT74_SARSR|nr:hypothetical protein NLU13_2191 [Sarocladium strictum]